MTEIYLVYAQKCTKCGMVKMHSKFVAEVFTNKFKAREYVKYFNKRWERYIEKGGDFEKNNVLYYTMRVHEICNADYSKIPY